MGQHRERFARVGRSVRKSKRLFLLARVLGKLGRKALLDCPATLFNEVRGTLNWRLLRVQTPTAGIVSSHLSTRAVCVFPYGVDVTVLLRFHAPTLHPIILLGARRLPCQSSR